ncbi:MAG: hypothetical protein N3A72_04470 [bacterium]|nr:hypothetical protein [bacterium]
MTYSMHSLTFDLFDMLTALLWKEWRQSRLSILGIALFCAGYFALIWLFRIFLYTRIMSNLPNKSDWVVYDNAIRILWYYWFCGIVSATMGSLFSEERAKKTLQFLFIHPTTRTRIWFAKVWYSFLVIAGAFCIVAVFHRLVGAYWVWNEADIVRVVPYAFYISLAGFAISIFMGTAIENSVTSQIATVLVLVILYFGFQYYGKLDWRYILPLLMPISVVFIIISHVVFCFPDYWYQPFRKEWYKKIAWIALPTFLISWIPFLLEK